MFYVYIMCPHFKKYRWICRFRDEDTANESCNRKKANNVDCFVSTRSDLGISNDLGLNWEHHVKH